MLKTFHDEGNERLVTYEIQTTYECNLLNFLFFFDFWMHNKACIATRQLGGREVLSRGSLWTFQDNYKQYCNGTVVTRLSCLLSKRKIPSFCTQERVVCIGGFWHPRIRHANKWHWWLGLPIGLVVPFFPMSNVLSMFMALCVCVIKGKLATSSGFLVDSPIQHRLIGR